MERHDGGTAGPGNENLHAAACSLHSHKCLESGGYGAASMNFKQSFRVAANWQLELVIFSGCSQNRNKVFTEYVDRMIVYICTFREVRKGITSVLRGSWQTELMQE